MKYKDLAGNVSSHDGVCSDRATSRTAAASTWDILWVSFNFQLNTFPGIALECFALNASATCRTAAAGKLESTILYRAL